MTMSTASVEGSAPGLLPAGQAFRARARQTLRFIVDREIKTHLSWPDGFDLAAAGFAVAAPIMAMRAVDGALANDLPAAFAAALGLTGAIGLEAIARHCRNWRDAAAAYCDAPRRPRAEMSAALACAGAAAILSPGAALAGAGLILAAMIAIVILQDAAAATGADARTSRARAYDELNAPLGAAAAVKTAGLEMAFARRFEQSDDSGLSARRDAAGAAAIAASIPFHARAATVAVVLLVALAQPGDLAPGVILALALFAARMADPLAAHARRPLAGSP
ncbi:MAG: hypothetical protein ACOYM8_00520 [Caulobacterales bacterium]